MGECSYTWNEWDREKGEYVKKDCPIETWEGSSEYCIFHDPSPDKDVDLFKEKLRKQIQAETERHNFRGYYFPEIPNFSGGKFEIDVDFIRVNFQDSVYFRGATFQGTAYFTEATFQGTADFRVATFQNASYFFKANFQDAAYFLGATFQEEVELTSKNNEKIDLRYAKFLFRTFITADLSKTLFHRCFIENVSFVDCKWPDDYIIYEEKNMKDSSIDLTSNQLETIYRDLKQNMQNHGDYATAGELYYREMEMRRKGATKKNRLWLELYRLLAGYGEKPERTLLSSFFTIISFALLYWVLECLDYCKGNIGNLEEIVYTLYFSFVTFTTLGLGDITPLTHIGRVLICCEAVIGAFLIALFVVVFARKMMR